MLTLEQKAKRVSLVLLILFSRMEVVFHWMQLDYHKNFLFTPVTATIPNIMSDPDTVIKELKNRIAYCATGKEKKEIVERAIKYNKEQLAKYHNLEYLLSELLYDLTH
jgi:hypothetical protein